MAALQEIVRNSANAEPRGRPRSLSDRKEKRDGMAHSDIPESDKHDARIEYCTA
jgi:hypothetical protein